MLVRNDFRLENIFAIIFMSKNVSEIKFYGMNALSPRFVPQTVIKRNNHSWGDMK